MAETGRCRRGGDRRTGRRRHLRRDDGDRNRLTGINEDDLTLLGRPFAADPSFAKLAGVPVHLGNSVALALVYAAVAHNRIPGPPWLRGALFATLEDTMLYPIAMLEQFHPSIRDGQVDRYWTLPAYLLSIPVTSLTAPSSASSTSAFVDHNGIGRRPIRSPRYAFVGEGALPSRGSDSGVPDSKAVHSEHGRAQGPPSPYDNVAGIQFEACVDSARNSASHFCTGARRARQ